MTQIAAPGAGGPEEQSLVDSVTAPDPGSGPSPGQTRADGADPDRPEPAPTDGDAPADLPPAAATKEQTKADTRERILDVALDLFTRQGFDGTSLRQIAESLGLTKAALYYHFESKDDILLALHMRLHEFGKEALLKMEDEPVTLQQWRELLDAIVDVALAQRPLFLMHERNQAALEKLHHAEHDAEHEDLQNKFRQVLADARIPIEDRVRMSASFGVLFSGLFLAGEAFSAMTVKELGGLLRKILHDVLGG
jgi:AcrR family transcriptional regulator